MDALQSTLQDHRVYLCLSCGKCTAVCPISRRDADFSPRRFVETAIVDGVESLLREDTVWKCLTCLRCSELCPADVRFSEFTRSARGLAFERGASGACTHGDVIHTWMRMMADPELQQNRLDWVTDDLDLSADGDTLYFVGCLPQYDVLFSEQGFEGVEIARNTVRLLNQAGIAPRLLPDERCCGHDLLWAGDTEGFRRLAELNARAFQEAGIRRVVTACAECYRTLSVDYPAVAGLGIEVQHISQVLAQAVIEGRLRFDAQAVAVSFQDPCRLGRHMGEYDAPRALLREAVSDVREMENARQRSICCGTSVWMQCGQTAKSIQVARLQEARSTGAEVLATACPKCQIHFRCAMDDPDAGEAARIEIRDLVTILAGAASKS